MATKMTLTVNGKAQTLTVDDPKMPLLYPILTFPDAPDVVMDLIDRPDEKPWGAGEPTAAVVPSAISNAVFDALGIRLRSVPLTPDKVLAALKTA
jgi:CO/xanthine dehydrogenase Mo-binding subunit